MIKRNITSFFLLWEFFLYAFIIYIEFFSSTNYLLISIKYFSIICCFIYCAIIAFIYKDINFILIALFFTIIADYFLLLTNYYFIGILFFILVQIFYYLHLSNIKNFIQTLLFIILLCAIINMFIFLTFNCWRPLLLVLTLYILLMLSNILYYSYTIKKNAHIEIIFLLCGIVLLLLCDIHVALHNASRFYSISNSFLMQYGNISDKIVWIFYLPSQVCISLGNFFYYR